jgi:RsiW-degrading membrane proteinase PrsW (M82 family)
MSPAVIFAFITSVFLHFAWNYANTQQGTTVSGLLTASAGVISVGILSFYLLVRRMKEANGYRRNTA